MAIPERVWMQERKEEERRGGVSTSSGSISCKSNKNLLSNFPEPLHLGQLIILTFRMFTNLPVNISLNECCAASKKQCLSHRCWGLPLPSFQAW